MNREIKFRAWDKKANCFYPNAQNHIGNYETAFGNMLKNDRYIIMQYTGLKDKNGLTDIYEGDIIDVNGFVGGNIYEESGLLKDPLNIVIPPITSKDWFTAYKVAMDRGCRHPE